MTRPLPRRLLALALASALSTTPALVAVAQDAATAAPVAPFTVSDIRVDGLQRISAGTVFTYLPIERGDTVDEGTAGEAIRALYRTGFFEDVAVGRQGDILVVTVVERPAINRLTITGNKDIKTEDLLAGLNELGLSEGNTFDRLDLDRVIQELTRQYNNRGKYNVSVVPTVSPLERNRVDVTIAIEEGEAASIRHINLIGNQLFDEDQITENWESAEHNWFSWYRRDSQYSREKLSGDLEKLNNFYLDRGYVDFSIDSQQVAISPDRQDMFITVGLEEGEKYTISDVTLSGDTVLPREEVEKSLLVRSGQTFSRSLLEITADSITASLANIGYAFARVTPVPEINREDRTVSIDMRVAPGPRVNVRQVVFKGNMRTADEVLRREMRQFEGAWYSQAAIDRSKIRLQGLGFFDRVDVETQPVAGTHDQVDVVYTVNEIAAGTFMFGLGYSQLAGMSTQVQLSQNNFLGTGNRVAIQAQRNGYLQRYDFSFTNPYFTDNGVSLGYNLRWSEFDNSDFNTAQFSSTSGVGQVVLGVPITETDSITALVGLDSNQIFAERGYTPESIVDYIEAVGQRTFHAWRGEIGWGRNTLNSALTPSRGTLQRIWLEATLPGSTVEYYKINYSWSKFWPINRHLVLNTRTELGYGDSYGDSVTRHVCYTAPTEANPNPEPTPDCSPDAADYVRTVTADGLPFFENFYAGGTRSVRGFDDNTLGPREAALGSTYMQSIGGSFKTTGSLEMFFPSLIDSPAARPSAFIDFGNVYRDFDAFDAGELRASAGVALMWRSPMGPISISYAFPIKKEEGDELERLQFTFQTPF